MRPRVLILLYTRSRDLKQRVELARENMKAGADVWHGESALGLRVD